MYMTSTAGASWSPIQKLVASAAAASDFLGYRLAIAGDVIVASASANSGLCIDISRTFFFFLPLYIL